MLNGIEVTVDDNDFSVCVQYVDDTISFGDIVFIETESDADYGKRVSGYGTKRFGNGDYRSNESENYHLVVFRNV